MKQPINRAGLITSASSISQSQPLFSQCKLKQPGFLRLWLMYSSIFCISSQSYRLICLGVVHKQTSDASFVVKLSLTKAEQENVITIFQIGNITACIRHQYSKITILSSHRCLINTGIEKNEPHLDIDWSFNHPMSLGESKCWCSNIFFTLFKACCSIMNSVKLCSTNYGWLKCFTNRPQILTNPPRKQAYRLMLFRKPTTTNLSRTAIPSI